MSKNNIKAIDSDIEDDVQILEEKKQVLDLRFGMINTEHCASKYYFANHDGKRLPIIDLDGAERFDSFYSIEKIDDIHYKVSSLDFMYYPGVDSYKEIYGDKFEEAYNFFRFHYGIVAAQGNKISLVIPIVYKDLKMSNSNMLISQADDTYKEIYNGHELSSINTVNGKLGAINLDIHSDSYGLNVIPPVLDHFEDFDLKYNGFARVGIEEHIGYLSKEVDLERYQDYLKLLSDYKTGVIDAKTYMHGVKDSIAKLLISEEKMLDTSNNALEIEDGVKPLIKRPTDS